MTATKLREALRARPFRPFQMHLADGDVLQVRHPELALVTPDGHTAVVVSPGSEVSIVELFLITRLSRPQRPGSRRKRQA